MAEPKLIRSGGFGSVFIIEEDNKKYAVKVMDMSKSGGQTLDEAVAEARTLRKLRHDHITRYYGSDKHGNEFRLFMEFCDKEDMERYIERRRGKKNIIEEVLVVKWMFETSSALQYIHSQKLLHRDLKPANIFLTGDDLTAKIGDFGVSKFLDSPDGTAKTFAGTPYYMSPEIHKRQRYGQKTDVWSLGCCYFEIVTLKPVFGALSYHQLVANIVDGKVPDFPYQKYDGRIYDIIREMMNKDPKKRPNCDEILGNTVFEKFDESSMGARRKYDDSDVDIAKLNESVNKSTRSSRDTTEHPNNFKPIDPSKIKDTFALIDPQRLAAARSVKSTLKRTELANIDNKKHSKRDKDAESKTFFCEEKSTNSSSGSSTTTWSTVDTVSLLSEVRQTYLSVSHSSSSGSSVSSLSSTLKDLTKEMERLITTVLDTDMSTIRSVVSTCDMTTVSETILSSSDFFQHALLYELIFLWMSMTAT